MDQAESLRNLLQTTKSRKTKTIAVISGKGGVGKSNFSLNFSLSLANKGYKILLFDMDIGMGNIDILMGVSSKYSFTHLFEDQRSLREIITDVPNQVSFISGGTGLSSLFKLDDEKFQSFVNQLSGILPDYDFVIFDMGAGISKETLHFLLTVDELFVITTPEPTSITDAYSVMKHICLANNDIPFFVIANKTIDFREGTATLERIDQVSRRFLSKEIVKLGTLPDDRNVIQAVKRQIPFVQYAPSTAASKSMEGIASNYLTFMKNGKLIENQAGFIKKFRQLLSKR